MQISAKTTVFELVEYHPETEAVFARYSEKAGVCICCECLFCKLEDLVSRYDLKLDELITRLNAVVEQL